MAVIFVDLDEVLFPFALSYRDWRERVKLPEIPRKAWETYQINSGAIPGHQEVMERFYNDSIVLETPVIKGRTTHLVNLTLEHEIIICTSRYEKTEGPGTEKWVNAHAPWVKDILYCNWHKGPDVPDPMVSPKLGAVQKYKPKVLLDDTAIHLLNLPSHTTPILVERPVGVVSAPGAVSCSESMFIVDQLI